MRGLLELANGIDRTTHTAANLVRWGLLFNALLIAGNAFSRKFFSVASSNAFDLQWHFFAAVVLLMAAYTFQRDEHVRIDLFAHRLGERGLAWLDLAGIVLVLLPVCAAMVWLSMPFFIHSLLSGATRIGLGERSEQPGERTVAVGQFQIGKQPWHAGVMHAVAVTTGFLRHKRAVSTRTAPPREDID